MRYLDVDVCRKDGIKKVEFIETREVESAEFYCIFLVAFFTLTRLKSTRTKSLIQAQTVSDELNFQIRGIHKKKAFWVKNDRTFS